MNMPSELKPIRTKADHKAAMAEINRLWGSKDGTPEGDRLSVLAILVQAYEDKHCPMDPPDPVEAIKFRMDQMGWTRSDLEPLIGGRGRVSEVLSGKRRLTIEMIRKITGTLNIPADVLIRPTAMIAAAAKASKPKGKRPRSAA